MAEKDPQAESNRRRITQSPSVPFLWEEQPGIPKKEWKLNSPSASVSPPSSPQPFIMAIDCVPFVWDEIPETRLISFSPPQQKHQSTTTSYINLMDAPLPLPPALVSVRAGDTAYYERDIWSDDDHCDDHEANHQFQDGADFGQEIPCSKSDTEESTNRALVARVPSRPFKLVGSVPFMWEAKPGTPLSSFSWDMSEADGSHQPQANLLLLPPPPHYRDSHENNHVSIPKLDMGLEAVKDSAVMRVPSRPVKFVASVPFSWEEKPGKPLPSWQFFGTDQTTSNQTQGNGNNSSSSHYYDEMFEFDVESFSFDTDESLSSEPSLMANCLVPSAAISTAVPVQTNPFLSMDEDENYPQPDNFSDTESSYETEAASFVGSSLLEWLFPNFPPKSGVLEENESCKRVPQKLNPPKQLETGQRDLGYSINGSFAIRKPKTLGELIMMSRRRSYVRKAAQVRKQNPSMRDFVKRTTFGCWTFGQGLNLKRQLRLKI